MFKPIHSLFPPASLLFTAALFLFACTNKSPALLTPDSSIKWIMDGDFKLIFNEKNLLDINTNLNDKYKLATNIDLKGKTFLNSIINGSFTGTFDGNGKSILNGYISNITQNNIGMFKKLGNKGQIKNLGVENVHVFGNYFVGGLVASIESNANIAHSYSTGKIIAKGYIGGLVAKNYGSISHSYSTGKVIGSTIYAGGLVAKNYGSISHSHSTGKVMAKDYVGGLVGHSEGTITNSYATGNVSGNSHIGGLAGTSYSSSPSPSSLTIFNSYATGNASGKDFIGGLVGSSYSDSNSSLTIFNSYATGSVSGENNVGGLAGSAYSEYDSSLTISHSYATGSVSGNSRIGGLAGSSFSSSSSSLTISHSYATGSVSGKNSVGGLVGKNDFVSSDTIIQAYASGSVIRISGTSPHFGSIVGQVNNKLTAKYVFFNAANPIDWNGTTIGNGTPPSSWVEKTYLIGIKPPLNTTKFIGFDFKKIWILKTPNTWPLLRTPPTLSY